MTDLPRLPRFIARMLPFDRRVVDVNSHSIHAIDHGTGRPVLLLHGNPTWSFLWRKVIAALDPGSFRCVAPDLPGFGLSTKPQTMAAHTLELHTFAIAALVERLGLRDVILVGQDWGGPIAACVAARMPERIAGVVLGNTAVVLPERFRGTPFHRFARLPLVSDLSFRWLGLPIALMDLAQGDRRSISGKVKLAYTWPLRHVRERAGVLALARMVPDGPNHRSVPALRQGDAWLRGFDGPVSLVWGERDPILGRALRRHTSALPNAHVTRTAAGHFLQEEVPDALAAAIRDVDRRLMRPRP